MQTNGHPMTELTPEQAIHYLRHLEDHSKALQRALFFRDLEITRLRESLEEARLATAKEETED
jgi:uncharacterized protein YciW